jgi:DNA-binding transcriptional LysR family regulator
MDNNNLRAIRLFVRVAELKSLTNVAKEFNVAKSVVSKEINRLEDRLGVKLLIRSTRKVRLTQIGEGYLSYCQDALIKLEEAENFISSSQLFLKESKLRINAPMALGLRGLDDIVASFISQYPNISLEINLSDDSIDLIEMGSDLSLRIASQSFDSPYVGVPLSKFTYAVCVSRDYFKSHAPIENPNCFEYSYFRGKKNWPIGDGVSINGTLKVNSTLFMKSSIRKGLGVGFLPSFVCDEELNTGEFQDILKEYERPELTFYALYADRRLASPQVKLFIEFVKDWYTTHPLTLPCDVRNFDINR